VLGIACRLLDAVEKDTSLQGRRKGSSKSQLQALKSALETGLGFLSYVRSTLDQHSVRLQPPPTGADSPGKDDGALPRTAKDERTRSAMSLWHSGQVIFGCPERPLRTSFSKRWPHAEQAYS
jgi:hypothetical protein